MSYPMLEIIWLSVKLENNQMTPASRLIQEIYAVTHSFELMLRSSWSTMWNKLNEHTVEKFKYHSLNSKTMHSPTMET